MRRVLKYDGLIPVIKKADGSHGDVTPERIREMKEYVSKNRVIKGHARRDFDVIKDGTTPGNQRKAQEIVRPYAEAEATWWTETMWGVNRLDAVRERIRAGPPSL